MKTETYLRLVPPPRRKTTASTPARPPRGEPAPHRSARKNDSVAKTSPRAVPPLPYKTEPSGMPECYCEGRIPPPRLPPTGGGDSSPSRPRRQRESARGWVPAKPAPVPTPATATTPAVSSPRDDEDDQPRHAAYSRVRVRLERKNPAAGHRVLKAVGKSSSLMGA